MPYAHDLTDAAFRLPPPPQDEQDKAKEELAYLQVLYRIGQKKTLLRTSPS